MANELLTPVKKKENLTDSDADMQLSFEPARAGKGCYGVVVGCLVGYKTSQIMLCRISQLLLKCQQREVHWMEFQLIKQEWLRIFETLKFMYIWQLKVY